MIRYLIIFAVCLVVCFVYAATRRKQKRDIIRFALRTFLYFLAAILGLGLISYLICLWR
jgi:hypothetical protein